jgi:hypothetical protein
LQKKLDPSCRQFLLLLVFKEIKNSPITHREAVFDDGFHLLLSESSEFYHTENIEKSENSLMKNCMVFIPASTGGHYTLCVSATSSFDAAWQALQEHERRNPAVGDDAILNVVVDGKPPSVWDFKEHNAAQPNYRMRVGRLREWIEHR